MHVENNVFLTYKLIFLHWSCYSYNNNNAYTCWVSPSPKVESQ